MRIENTLLYITIFIQIIFSIILISVVILNPPVFIEYFLNPLIFIFIVKLICICLCDYWNIMCEALQL